MITLSENQSGVIINNDKITYADGSKVTGSIEVNNIITATTPNGGRYQITLPDGTKVWLNAASSIKFPARFNVSHREVELDGDAYFEVAKLTARAGDIQHRVPFEVKTDKQKIEVYGTHFNVNAYSDEAFTSTTLLEGSVRIVPRNDQAKMHSRLLRPGEQAILENSSAKKIQVQRANIEKVMAWKNGYFNFEKDDLQTVMRKLARWYDLEVVYKVNRYDDRFVGDISQNVNLSEVLKILEYGGVSFKFEGRKITVIK